MKVNIVKTNNDNNDGDALTDNINLLFLAWVLSVGEGQNFKNIQDNWDWSGELNVDK